jgi:hypothetical protein
MPNLDRSQISAARHVPGKDPLETGETFAQTRLKRPSGTWFSYFLDSRHFVPGYLHQVAIATR